VGAWRVFVTEGRGKDRLLAAGFTEDQLDEMGSWSYGKGWTERAATVLEDLDNSHFLDDTFKGDRGELAEIEFFLVQEDPTGFALSVISPQTPNPERMPDDHKPWILSLITYLGETTSIIPKEILLKRRDFLVPLLADYSSTKAAWYVYGGAISHGHDQMTAIPKNRREGGIYIALEAFGGLDVPTFLKLIFENGDRNSFPGFVGHNHFVRHGPLKEDWTETCPFSYSKEEIEELCISEQEAVWGTELLGSLEKFKAELDPQNLMTCNTGVGFGNIATKPSIPVTSTPVDIAPAPTVTSVDSSSPSIVLSSNTSSAGHNFGMLEIIVSFLSMVVLVLL